MNATTLRVRTYECDSLGHVNNAVYIQYLQQATRDAVGERLTARKLAIEYHAPARECDELKIETWIADAEDKRITCGYEITRESDHATVVRSKIEWEEREHRARMWNVDQRALPLKPFAPISDNGAKPFRWRHTVRRYELDSSNHVSLAALFNWLEEATYGYCDRVGWGMERFREENFIVLQRRHDAEFLVPAQYGDEIEVVSRLIDVRRVRGTWIHEMFNAGTKTLLMRDYSTGAFVDWSGNIKPALMPMTDALMRGEPRSVEQVRET